MAGDNQESLRVYNTSPSPSSDPDASYSVETNPPFLSHYDNFMYQHDVFLSDIQNYARSCHSSRLIYGLYGVTDGINLFYSLCNLFFLFRHAYQHVDGFLSAQESQYSSADFHDAENTTTGFLITCSLAVLLVGYAACGSYFDADDTQNPEYLRQMAFYYPYIRDALKLEKWWSKGVRNILAIATQYIGHPDVLTSLFLPLSIGLGALALLNKAWLRWMRDQRKDMMKINNASYEKIIKAREVIHFLDSMPGVKNEPIVQDASIKGSLNTSSVDSLQQYQNTLLLIGKKGDTRTLYYVNSDAEAIAGNNTPEFEGDLESVITQNLHQRMERYLQVVLLPPESPPNLHFYQKPDDLPPNLSSLKNSFVYFTSAEDGCCRLVYIDDEGSKSDSKHVVDFHQKYIELSQDKHVTTPSERQVRDILKKHPLCFNNIALSLGCTEDNLKRLKNSITIQDQDTKMVNFFFFEISEVLVARFAAGASGFFDCLYFYFGTLGLSVFVPQLYLGLLMCSIVLSIVCIIARLHEEYDYKRKIDLTKSRVSMELSKSEAILLAENLEKLLIAQEDEASKSQNSVTPPRERVLSRTLSEDSNEIVDGSTAGGSVVIGWESLQAKLLEYKGFREQFEEHQVGYYEFYGFDKKTNGPYLFAALDGLRHGLAMQGVVASIMFTVATLCFASGACPPAFVVLCMVFSVLAIVVGCLQGMYSYDQYRQKVKAVGGKSDLEFANIEAFMKMEGNPSLQSKSAQELQETLAYLKNREIDAPFDFKIIDCCELFRLFFSGLYKGPKAIKEFFIHYAKNPETPKWLSVLITIMTILSAIFFAIVLALRYFAKNFSAERVCATKVKDRSDIARAYQKPVATPDRIADNPSPIAQGILRPASLLTSMTSFFYNRTSNIVNEEAGSFFTPPSTPSRVAAAGVF